MDIKYPIENEYMKCVLQINGVVVRVPRSDPAFRSGWVRGRDTLDVNGHSRPKETTKGMLKDTRPDWLLKGIHSKRALISQRLSHQFLSKIPLG